MKCKDCIYEKMCETRYEKEHCYSFKDKSLFIELPCKVGDTVYAVNNGKVHKTTVYSLHIETENGHYCYFIKCSIFVEIRVYILRRLGEGVYLTREEAEKALAERSKM
jgi:hypothetical protein